MRPDRREANLSSGEGAGDNRTDLYEMNTHSFIVKVWLEETAKEAGRAMWRGHITHVPSGERRYVRYLDEITAFIRFYLEKMGVDMKSRLWQWLNRRMRI